MCSLLAIRTILTCQGGRVQSASPQNYQWRSSSILLEISMKMMNQLTCKILNDTCPLYKPFCIFITPVFFIIFITSFLDLFSIFQVPNVFFSLGLVPNIIFIIHNLLQTCHTLYYVHPITFYFIALIYSEGYKL
jgi:hypothetical protein